MVETYSHWCRRSAKRFVSAVCGRECPEGDVSHEPAGALRTAAEFRLKEMTEKLFADLESGGSPAAGWYTAHCDGGSRGNPGPAGFGAVVEDPEGKVVAKLSEYLGRQTNNFAEYKGLLAVLTWAKEHGARQLRVVADSELMVKQMKGQYKVASPSLRPLWEEARRLARDLDRFEMQHTLRGGNKEADRLANEAMDRGMGRPVGELKAGLGGSPKAAAPAPKPSRQIFEGIVKNGVVHLLNGELPEGSFVRVTKE